MSDDRDWVDRKLQLSPKHMWMAAGAVFYLGMQAAGALVAINRLARVEAAVEERATIEQVNEVHADMTIYIDRGDEEITAEAATTARRTQTALDRAEANRKRGEAMNTEVQVLRTRFELAR